MINKLGQPLIYTWIEAHDKWSGYVLVLSRGFNPNLHRRSMWQFCSLANQGKPYVSHRPKSKNVHKISKRSITYIENPCSYSITHPFIECSSVVVILGLGKSRFNTTPSQFIPSTIFISPSQLFPSTIIILTTITSELSLINVCAYNLFHSTRFGIKLRGSWHNIEPKGANS